MGAQADYWNGEAGATWAAEADALEAMLAPFGALALDRLGPVAGRRVLDIGCGAGATSRALADAGAQVVGVDVSAPLLAVAQARGGGPAYLRADAGADPLPGPFDAFYSRFGVMFFEDPPAAFAHLRAAAAPGARLSFVCWGPLEENAWATAPVLAALPHLPAPPEPTTPGAPGPFAFAAPGRAAEVLTGGGWGEVAVEAWRGPYRLSDSLDAAAPLMLKIGPLGRLVRETGADPTPVLAAVRTLLAGHLGPLGEVTMPASVWLVTARTMG